MRIVPFVYAALLLIFPCGMSMAAELATTAVKAEQGDAVSQWRLGVDYLEGRGGMPQDTGKAEFWLRKAAEQGLAKAQYRLGRLYDKGQGVDQDLPGAAAWYRQAAEQGVTAAQNNLGNLYRDGRGVLQDHEAAVTWYRKAATQGDSVAQFNLGLMYGSGLGVVEDKDQALFWYRKSAKQGNVKAQAKLRAVEAGESVAVDADASESSGEEGNAEVAPSASQPAPVATPKKSQVQRSSGARRGHGSKKAARRHKSAALKQRAVRYSVGETVVVPTGMEGLPPGRETPLWGSRAAGSEGAAPSHVTGHFGAQEQVTLPAAAPVTPPAGMPDTQESRYGVAQRPQERETAVLHFQRIDMPES
ncbi:MAG: sel1 repeat family protein, partial [Magnetococcales bacterium]|nr:sel1 repeat family protein [Magnetococcales bacterium]